MTSQNDRIQALIAEIDSVLHKASPRLPWVMSGDVAQHRRVLERVRSYLVSLQPQAASEKASPQPKTRRAMLSGTSPGSEPPPAYAIPPSATANPNQQMLQAFVQDLRTAAIAPLQSELETLRQQREALHAELSQLQLQRQQVQQQASVEQMMREVLQGLSDRLQERLSQQAINAIAYLEAEQDLPALNPQQRLEQLRSLAAQSDQLLMSLDSSLRVIFETLQRDLKSYNDSLSQGIDKMHSLGQQGEVMFSALIKRLAEDLGREASSYIQTRPEPHLPPFERSSSTEKSLRPSEVESRDRELETVEQTENPTPQAETPSAQNDYPLPYPGVELGSSVTINPSSEEIDLSALGLGDWEINADASDIETLLDIDTSLLETEAPETELEDRAPLQKEESQNVDVSANPDLDSAIELLEMLNAPDPQEATLSETVTDTEPTNREDRELPPGYPEPEAFEELYDALFGIDSGSLPPATQPEPPDFPPSPIPPGNAPNSPAPLSEPHLEEADDPSAKLSPGELEQWETAIEEDLFGGLGEPAADPTVEWAMESSASLENWLFNDPARTTVTAPNQRRRTSPTVAFNSESPELEELTAAETIDSETLANFVELFSDNLEAEEFPTELEVDSAAELTDGSFLESETLVAKIDLDSAKENEDIFIPASPEESLLPNETPQAEFDLNFWPDATTLEQLRTDLSSLESLEGWEILQRPGTEKRSPERKELQSDRLTPLAQPLETNLNSNELQPLESIPDQLERHAEAGEEITLGDFAEALDPPLSSDLPVDEPTPSPTAEEDVTLEDFAEALDTPTSSDLPVVEEETEEAPTVAETEAPTVNLDNLDDLFAEMPSVPPSSVKADKLEPSPTLTEVDTQDLTIGNAFTNFTAEQMALANSELDLDRQLPESSELDSDEDPEKKRNLIPDKEPQVVVERFSRKATDEPVWYLGIDFGTTGISAVLLNASSRCAYPLYWLEGGQIESDAQKQPLVQQFRLQPAVYLSIIEGESSQELASPYQLANTSIAVGPLALKIAAATSGKQGSGLFLHNLKPLVKLAVPYYSAATERWEPVLAWSEAQQVSMGWVRQALQALFASLSPLSSHLWLQCGVMGLDASRLQEAGGQLAGVVVGCPASWSDTYRFNLREAVLGAKLVERPEQVVFLEDAIATILSELRDTAAGSQWRGSTLAINSGATMTELALVNLPDDRQQLRHQSFKVRSFAYAGNGIDQDIIGQLLLKHPDAQLLEELGLDAQAWPQPGDPGLEVRYQLQQRLESSGLGRTLLRAARHLKQVLQEQDSFHLEIGRYDWVVRRKDLEMQVFLPYLRRLNRELNALLSETGVATQGINQAMCTGGTASLGAIARWLRQKLPSAAIVQDTYPGDRTPGCSRVAYGLATLPFYPQILELPRQQYSDFFLLSELLRIVPDEPLSAKQILQRLERQGINTRACQKQIMAFLDGHLPPGLVPSESDGALLTEASRGLYDYQILMESPLFDQPEPQTYCLDRVQRDRLQQYLNRLTDSCIQKLEEPYIFNFGAVS